jgi:hypothetical protein
VTDDTERVDAVVDLAERVELLAEQAHPHDACRRLVAHLTRETNALFTYLTQLARAPNRQPFRSSPEAGHDQLRERIPF